MAGAIVTQNVTFLNHQCVLFTSLNHVYGQVLNAAEDPGSAPLGFANLPAWLAWRSKTYALISEGVMYTPSYTNVGEFVEVNRGWRAAKGVMFTPVIEAVEPVMYGFRGEWLDWEQLRRFAMEHRTVFVTRYKNERFELE